MPRRLAVGDEDVPIAILSVVDGLDQFVAAALPHKVCFADFEDSLDFLPCGFRYFADQVQADGDLAGRP